MFIAALMIGEIRFIGGYLQRAEVAISDADIGLVVQHWAQKRILFPNLIFGLPRYLSFPAYLLLLSLLLGLELRICEIL